MTKAALFLTAAMFTFPAFAADIPTLTGTWKGTSDGAALKGGWLSGNVMIVISEQKGRSFRGEISYPIKEKTVTEPIVGTLDADGDRILFTGDNGHHIADFTNGVIDDCFINDGERSMAVCATLTKQP